MYNSKAKLKMFYVMCILQDEADTKDGLSFRRFIERSRDYDVKAEHKGLYSDIQALNEFRGGHPDFPEEPSGVRHHPAGFRAIGTYSACGRCRNM